MRMTRVICPLNPGNDAAGCHYLNLITAPGLQSQSKLKYRDSGKDDLLKT